MVRPFLCLYLICSWMDTRLLGDGGGTIKKKKKKKGVIWQFKNKTKQNELYEYFNSRGMSKICNYPCVWICATLFPACHSPDSLSLPSWLRLWWVNELNVALACMISPWSVWIKWSIFRPSDAHISEFRLNPSRQVFSDPELNLACKWICLCWINSDGNLPTLDGRAFYQCVLPQGFRLYKIQLDTLKKMHSHGGIRVEVREPWLNLLKSFFSSAVFFPLLLSCFSKSQLSV